VEPKGPTDTKIFQYPQQFRVCKFTLTCCKFSLRMRVILMLRTVDVEGKDIAFRRWFREHNPGSGVSRRIEVH
jgi:hypothetical protein